MDFVPPLTELTSLLSVEVELQKDSFIKEYCFVYPIIPAKKGKLLTMYEDKAIYFSQQVHDIYQFRGISKMQLSIQESTEKPYLVLYQEITGSVNEARKKYLNSKDEEFVSNVTKNFSEVTGLSFEGLLPNLESLDDDEILK